MNRGVIFFLVIAIVILAIIFIPKNKDGMDTTNEAVISEEMSADLQGSVSEAMPVEGAPVVETIVETTEVVPAVETSTEVAQ